MNIGLAILIKLLSVLLFAMMSALVRFVGDVVPVGQVVFFRSAFAIVPVLAIYAWRGEIGAAVRTGRPLGHLTRGLISVASMFLNFAALARLPLVDATAISFAAPFITVALAAVVLGERVRAYRWSAVVVGFCGVVVMLWPYLDVPALIGSGLDRDHRRCVVRHHRGLHQLRGSDPDAAADRQRDHRLDRVLLLADLHRWPGLATLPFAWVTPNATQLAALIAIGIIGGLSHIFLTESYRWAPASVVAPFDYAALLWAFLFGYVLFGEVPTIHVYAGAAIVAASGLFVIWRERQLARARGKKTV